jgi:hypothetical protein
VQEYDAPVLEMDELYIRKAGEAGEEILGQMYNFVVRDTRSTSLDSFSLSSHFLITGQGRLPCNSSSRNDPISSSFDPQEGSVAAPSRSLVRHPTVLAL